MKYTSTMMNWDGAPLGDKAIVDLQIEWDEAPSTKPSMSLLEEAIRRASRADGGRRGILIEGAPGSGKSVLCHVFERRLGQPPFNDLGVVVRWGERELAVALERSPHMLQFDRQSLASVEH